jgi:DNA-binding IclR family transcriptional regulator
MQDVLKYLKKYGQRLDTEIAAGTGLPLTKVRRSIAELAEQGAITHCKVTRFNGDEKFVGILCRASAFIPPSSPGRKPGAAAS